MADRVHQHRQQRDRGDGEHHRRHPVEHQGDPERRGPPAGLGHDQPALVDGHREHDRDDRDRGQHGDADDALRST
jgi:hypothetical protein